MILTKILNSVKKILNFLFPDIIMTKKRFLVKKGRKPCLKHIPNAKEKRS